MQARSLGRWQTAIKRLWSKNWTDQDICEALWDLSDEAIGMLEACGWNRDRLAEALQPCSGDLRWTARMVKHWRLSQDPPLRSQRASCAIMQEARQLKMDAYAYHQGWGHYIGRSEEIVAALKAGASYSDVAEALNGSRDPDNPIGSGWTADLVARWDDRPWDTLRKAEVEALNLVERQGKCLRQDVARSHSMYAADVLGSLLRKGLLIRCGRLGFRGPLQYALAPGVCKYYPATKTPTSLDRMSTLFGWIG